jgi:hypothetical protein
MSQATKITSTSVVPLHPFDETAALDWLRSQPGGRTNLKAAELGRRWGWGRHRPSRRIEAWAKGGLVTRRGNTIIAVMDKPVTPPVTPPGEDPGASKGHVTPPETPAEHHVTPPVPCASQPLVALAYGFFGLGIGINIWNASGGNFTDVVLPATMGVLAEGVMFFLPAWAMGLPMARRMLALALLMLLVVPFALINSLRMASIISADQSMIRADRQTLGTESAESKLDKAQAARDQACGKGLGKTVACQSRQSEVTKLEGKQTQATAKVAVQAKPEAGDFTKLVKWVTFGHLEPKADDFDVLWLLLRMLLPQIGGVVLMLAAAPARR